MLRRINSSGIKTDPKGKTFYPFLFSALSGIILSLAYINGKLWPLALFGFVPLFFILQTPSALSRFVFAWICGLVFWAITIYWLIHVTLLGAVILVLYLSLYFGLFGVLAGALDNRPKDRREGFLVRDCLFIAFAWVVLEYARSNLMTGFGWALLGYSQCYDLVVIQLADIAGVWLVSFFVMMVNIMLYQSLRLCGRVAAGEALKRLFIPIVIIILVVSYGSIKLRQYAADKYQPVKNALRVSVVPGNIPQELKWDPYYRSVILSKYLDLSRQAAEERPDLIVWPEAAIPILLEEEGHSYIDSVRGLAIEKGAPVLLGAVRKQGELYYNSAVLIDPSASQDKTYDKLHLVPFGEYIPLRRIFTFLETIAPIGDIEPGRQYTVFTIDDKKNKARENFSVLICFEDVFPVLSRNFVKNKAGFLINITNDAWYKRSTAAYQHFQTSIFRAVENRIFLVRAANTGISAIIEPSGMVASVIKDQKGSDIFVEGYKTFELYAKKTPLSLYTIYGDWFVFLSALGCCGLLITFKLKRKCST